MTTSREERDIKMAYDLHANWYITKPSDVKEVMSIMHLIASWMNFVKVSQE